MSDEITNDVDLDGFDQVTTDILSWKDAEEGTYIVGTIVDIFPFTGGQFETDVMQYIISTKDGLVSTVLGSATDKQLKGVVKKGDKVYIEFKGKAHLDDGRSVNKFRVMKAKNAS